jgi:hypothetical protein
VLLSGFSSDQAGVSERDHFVLSGCTCRDSVDGSERRHFPIEIHAAERIQLADERQGHWVIDQIVPANAASMKFDQMTVKTAHNGNEIHRILNGIGVGCGLLLDGIGSCGDGGAIWHYCSSKKGFTKSKRVFPRKLPYLNSDESVPS